MIENLVPSNLLHAPDPFKTSDDYREWHVMRRIRSLGLVQSNSSEDWGGIIEVKSKERKEILKRLVGNGSVIPLEIKELPKLTLFIRADDLPVLDTIKEGKVSEPGAAFLAPLDNFMWSRRLVERIFDFNYRWEVYKPKAQRQYGYYVLPVIYGDSFVGRFDPAFDKKERILTIQNWWWEKEIVPDELMRSALSKCLSDFCKYLQVSKIQVAESIQNNPTNNWIKSFV